jgi:hypothetical protein
MTKKSKIKKDGVYVEEEKTLIFENSELEKIHFELIVNKIKKELDDMFPKSE